jgi:multiple sugar transport system ATP-binding protein
VQVGTPHDIYERPINAYVAARLGSPAINLLPIDVLPAHEAPREAVRVGARTEHVEVTPADDGPAEVVMVEHLAARISCT